jgi:hypothetical protein
MGPHKGRVLAPSFIQRQASHPCARFHKGCEPREGNFVRAPSLSVERVVDPPRTVMNAAGAGGVGRVTAWLGDGIRK